MNEINTNTTCQYEIQKGGRRGQICGCSTRGGSKLCAKHKQTMEVRKLAIDRMTNKYNQILQDVAKLNG